MTPLESYPIQLRLAGKPVLVAGAGQVATRKIARLVASGAQVQVVAQVASGAVSALAAAGKLQLELRSVEDADTHGKFLVIAATNDARSNARLAAASRASGALVARVDAPDDSDFSLPAIARSPHLAAAVSSHGSAPSASRRLARELEHWLLSGPDRFAAELGHARERLRGRPDAARRLRELADGPLFEACQRQDEATIAALLASALAGAEPNGERSDAGGDQ
jgi:siroheme synthase-like protein